MLEGARAGLQERYQARKRHSAWCILALAGLLQVAPVRGMSTCIPVLLPASSCGRLLQWLRPTTPSATTMAADSGSGGDIAPLTAPLNPSGFRPTPTPGPRRLCVAPMMDWTDRQDRYFLRRFSKHTWLYTGKRALKWP